MKVNCAEEFVGEMFLHETARFSKSPAAESVWTSTYDTCSSVDTGTLAAFE